jgi:DnaJ homolog subfamily C member 28
MNRRESMAEKMLREAIEAGEFDNLPGKGKPIDLSENPFEDPDLRVVHKLLRDAGFAPAWIEERKDIDAEFGLARETLSRAWKLYNPAGRSPNPANWERNVQEFRGKVAELNRRIKIYNLKAPAAVFHRRVIDGDKVIEEIREAKGSD